MQPTQHQGLHTVFLSGGFATFTTFYLTVSLAFIRAAKACNALERWEEAVEFCKGGLAVRSRRRPGGGGLEINTDQPVILRRNPATKIWRLSSKGQRKSKHRLKSENERKEKWKKSERSKRRGFLPCSKREESRWVHHLSTHRSTQICYIERF